MRRDSKYIKISHGVYDFIILRQAALVNRTDINSWKILFHEYGVECPLFEVENLLSFARIALDENAYDSVLDSLFSSTYTR